MNKVYARTLRNLKYMTRPSISQFWIWISKESRAHLGILPLPWDKSRLFSKKMRWINHRWSFKLMLPLSTDGWRRPKMPGHRPRSAEPHSQYTGSWIITKFFFLISFFSSFCFFLILFFFLVILLFHFLYYNLNFNIISFILLV